jgi:hypothetical protein
MEQNLLKFVPEKMGSWFDENDAEHVSLERKKCDKLK